jgi:hypothetical protein
MTSRFLSPRDAARRLGLSVSRLVQLDRAGELVAMRDSAGRRLYLPETVEAFALQRRNRGVRAAAQTI